MANATAREKEMSKSAPHIAFTTLTALGLCLLSSGVSAADAAGETQRCIHLTQIDESPIIDDRTILVKMRGKSGFKRMDLSGTCTSIARDGYTRVSPENAICTSDSLQVLGPIPSVCQIERIVTIDATEASALEARKR
jgi:hypothetical protein